MKFIAIEGIDGAGKSTLIEQLKAEFSQRNLPTWFTYEHGGVSGPFGQAMRDLLHNVKHDIDPLAELLLYIADRSAHSLEIKRHLDAGELVITDRYLHSTTAYQGYGRELMKERWWKSAAKLNQEACHRLKPDLTLLLDLDVEIALEREGKGASRVEQAGYVFYQRVRQGYLEIAQADKHWVVVDASKLVGEVKERVAGEILKVMG